MSPNVDKYSARVGVDRAEQSAYCVVKTDDKNSRADRLQVLWHKTQPEFLACADDEHGDEQDDQIAFKPEELGQLAATRAGRGLDFAMTQNFVASGS